MRLAVARRPRRYVRVMDSGFNNSSTTVLAQPVPLSMSVASVSIWVPGDCKGSRALSFRRLELPLLGSASAMALRCIVVCRARPSDKYQS